MFLHSMKKKTFLCRFVHFRGNIEVTNNRLQDREYHLLCILQLLYSLYTGAHLISQPCCAPALRPDLHKQKVKLATWEMMFSVIQKKKKQTKKNLRSTSVKLFFSSFILTNDITVQLLASVVAGGREVGQAG